MKLIFAIVHDDDGPKVISELNRNGFSVTKLCSTGGFLRSGNTTLLVGVEKINVDKVIKIIEKKSRSRKQTINTQFGLGNLSRLCPGSPVDTLDDVAMPGGDYGDISPEYPVEVVVGGATIFVVNVEQYEKV